MGALNTLPHSFRTWPLKTREIWKENGSKTAPLPHGLSAERGGQVLLSWVLLHGNMRRGRRMQREGNRANHHKFTSGEETSDGEDKAREGGSEVWERGGKWRCSLHPPPPSHRSIAFQGKCYWKARHGGENWARCYEIPHYSSWDLNGSSSGCFQP